MDIKQAAEILRKHNEWRRDSSGESRHAPQDPILIGEAMDVLVAHALSAQPDADAQAEAAGHINFNSIKQCPDGWLSIVAALDRLLPGTGIEAAVCTFETLAARQPVGVGPVAVVGDVFTLHWAGTGPIAPLIERHGIKVGDKLYPAPPAPTADDGELAAWRELADHVRTGAPVYPGRYTDDRTHDVASFIRTHQRMPAPAAVPVDGLPPLPIAFFDEFGQGADDRVQDYARTAMLATHPQPAAAGGDA